MKKSCVRSRALILAASFAFALAGETARAKSSFPTQGSVESTQSYGEFSLILKPSTNIPSISSITSLLSSLGFGKWISPTLYDPATLVGVGSSVTQGRFFGGQSVSIPGAGSVSPSNYANIPSPFVVPPTKGDGNMVVTAIESLDLSSNGRSPGSPGNVSVLIGSAANITLPTSYGMVESISWNSDFPARSFFALYVEISFGTPDGPIELSNVKPGSVSTSSLDPLVVENVPSSPTLPPDTFYEEFGWPNPVPIYFANGPYAGDQLGYIGLAALGVGPGSSRDFPVALLIPEPSTWAMMLLGFCGLGFVAYRQKQKLSALGA
jgi:hypothetical protein